MHEPNNTVNIRQALRTFQYGLHVLTTGQGSAAHAATISWVTQISFKPRRIAIGVRKDSHIYEMLREHGAFALNVLGEGQDELASTFFKYVPVADQSFGGHAFEDGPATGAPVLNEVPAWLECRVVEEANADGDHGLFVADVLGGGLRHESPKPLNLSATGWNYGG